MFSGDNIVALLLPILILVGVIMGLFIKLKEALGAYSWMVTPFILLLAAGIVAFVLLKPEQFKSKFKNKYAVTLAFTVVSALLAIAIMMLPKGWKS